jgi:5-amino-6-(5-phospho-D-ribitylamino)uracil phosphatase
MSPFYVSDLDGTLLSNSATLSEFSRNELQRLLTEGVAFSVASARSVVTISSILQGVRLQLPVIEFNGAFISDLESGQHRVVNNIDSNLASELYETMIRHGHVPLISTFNGAEDCLYYSEIVNAGARWYVDDRKRNNDRRLRTTQNIPGTLAEQVVCITAIGSRPQLKEVAEDIDSKRIDAVEMHLFENRYSPGWYWLTVHDKRASKEQAVRTLMDMEGLSDRPLVVFGDEVNDLKLFDIASESVAVANAGPHIRSRAKHVIGSNEEDSVVKFIRNHWSGIAGKSAS